MNDTFLPQNIDSAISRIAQYAREHQLSPVMVCDIFSAGLCAARILSPQLANAADEMHNVELSGEPGSNERLASFFNEWWDDLKVWPQTKDEIRQVWDAAISAGLKDATCRNDGRCQYAIDHGAEGLGYCPKGKCVMAR